MSKFLGELCSLLIEDVYGEFYAHIFSNLLSHGRLVAPQLARTCRLSLRQLQHGLAVLIQAGLIYHNTNSEGSTSYEANPRNAYHLVRAGRVLETVHKRYGKASSAIVTQLLLLGHASVGQLKKQCRPYDELLRTHGRDTEHDAASNSWGFDNSAGDRADVELDNALRNLCMHGMICRLRQGHFRTLADNRQMAEETVYNHPIASTAKGAKARDEIAARIDEALEKQVDPHISLLKPGFCTRTSQKRKSTDLNDDTPNVKRMKLTDRATTQTCDPANTSLLDDEVSAFNESLIVTLNYARTAILVRNSRLLALVSDIYGRIVSRTYEAILKQLEPDMPDPIEYTMPGRTNRPHQVSSEVNEDRLAQDLAHREINDERSGSEWASTNGHMNGIRHRITSEVRSHLEILCQQPYAFLSHSPEHPDRYVVEYSDLSEQLRNAEVSRIISSRFDQYASRIIRVLLEKGKVDEKYLQEIVLMSAKELRQTLALLQQAGFVELQEVPREAQRQPSRTIYLWFYDPDRVRKMLIEDTYKCMARCLQRMKVERERIKPTIAKSERSDVRGHEEQLLGTGELEVLRAWRLKEEWLLGEVGRLDELIFVLRDF